MSRKIVSAIMSAAVVAMIGVSGWIFYSVNVQNSQTSETRISVNKGLGIRSVAGELYRAHLIQNRQAWILFAALTGQHRAVLPGNYVVAAGMSGRQLLQLLTLGPNDDREVTVTFPEGMRLTDMAELLASKGVLSQAAFLQFTRHPADFVGAWKTDLFSSKPPGVDLEGYLFPDTYRFFKDSPAETVVTRMVTNTDTKLSAEVRAKIAASGHTLHEILTMASILELELKTPADRAMAADLFWRRIAAGIPMQSDVTVNYATGKTRAHPSIADTQVDSPFNTYRVKGLPPGPIGSPGLASIQAALNPTPNQYLYYLTAPSGATIWATTYEEHLSNKQKYLSGS